MIEAFRLKKSTIKVVHMNYLLYSQCFEAEQYFCVRNLLLTENLHPQWAVTGLLVNWVKRFSKKNHKSDSRDIFQDLRNHKLTLFKKPNKIHVSRELVHSELFVNWIKWTVCSMKRSNSKEWFNEKVWFKCFFYNHTFRSASWTNLAYDLWRPIHHVIHMNHIYDTFRVPFWIMKTFSSISCYL